MAEVTRFYDRGSDADGPVSGAIQIIQIGMDDIANSETLVERVTMPAGMGFEITDIMFWADTITSDPTLTIGDTAAGTQIVAAVACTTALGALTIKDGTIDAAGMIDVRIVADSGDAVESGCISIVGYVTSPPTTLAYRA